jgi:hypothetical protein
VQQCGPNTYLIRPSLHCIAAGVAVNILVAGPNSAVCCLAAIGLLPSDYFALRPLVLAVLVIEVVG